MLGVDRQRFTKEHVVASIWFLLLLSLFLRRPQRQLQDFEIEKGQKFVEVVHAC